MLRQSGPRVAGKQQIVFAEQSAQMHLCWAGSLGTGDDTRRSAAYKNRRDAETYLVDEACLHHLGVPGRPTFTQHDLGTASMEFVEHGAGLRSGCRETDDLGAESTESGEPLWIRLFAGDHERALLWPPVVRGGVGGMGERWNCRVYRAAGSNNGQSGGCGAPSSKSRLDNGLALFRMPVTFGGSRAGRDHNPVATCTHRAKHLAVGGPSEISAQALDSSGAVEAGDHVDHDPRTVRRCRPRIVGVEVERVNVFYPGGKNLPHCRRPYRFNSRICRVSRTRPRMFRVFHRPSRNCGCIPQKSTTKSGCHPLIIHKQVALELSALCGSDRQDGGAKRLRRESNRFLGGTKQGMRDPPQTRLPPDPGRSGHTANLNSQESSRTTIYSKNHDRAALLKAALERSPAT